MHNRSHQAPKSKAKSKPKSGMSFNPALAQTIAAKLQQGFLLHNAGQLEQANIIYEEILMLSPKQFDALQLSGMIAAQKGQWHKAFELLSLALTINDSNAFVYNNFGNVLNELKRFGEALANFNKAVELKPDYIEAHSNRSNVLCDLNRLEDALKSYDKTIELRPDYAQAYSNRGDVLSDLGYLKEALASYEKAIDLQPTDSKAYTNRGNVLTKLNRLEEALESYSRALELKPDYALALYNRGNVLNELQQLEQALASYDKAIELKSDYPEAFYNRGNVLNELQHLEEALASYNKAVELKPDYAEAFYNRGNVLNELQHLEKALASYDKAIELKPDYAEAYLNRGNVLSELDCLNEALASYDQAIKLNPEYAKAHHRKSFSLLLSGNFHLGLIELEWRRLHEDSALYMDNRRFTQPLWLGNESLANKSILLYGEQGLGDCIQMCRYAKFVKGLGARVLLEAPKPLIGLLHSLEGIDVLIEKGTPLPDFDFQCPLMSLPLAFKTELASIPSPQPYLKSSAEKLQVWRERLGEKSKSRIGLVWSGNKNHKNDHKRSLLLADVQPHLPKNFEYISLQKEVREVDKQTLDKSPIRSYGESLHDFSDTAALCDLMDLVISVDTSVAHLAGSLGKTTWIVLPRIPDWRWLLERHDSPWYESVTLFRQGKDRQYAPVLEQVAESLLKLPKN